ncbi:MAG TPA: phosphoribosyltransferase [Pilimelia sp.]|nr:phosphoribosyltransferase [Pilimelia sp.]
MTDRYRDRTHGGAALARWLARFGGRADVAVLAVSRGGVPVAAAVAERLAAPLDVLVFRQLVVPWSPRLTFGTVGPGGLLVLAEEVAARVDPAVQEQVVRHETGQLRRLASACRGDRPAPDLLGRTALLVDDELVTGATARTGCVVARELGARRVVVAAPVGATEAVGQTNQVADEVVCPVTPAAFRALGRYYDHAPDVSDTDVARLLGGASMTGAGTVEGCR